MEYANVQRIFRYGSLQVILRQRPLLTFTDSSIQRSHKSSICENLATGIVRITPGVTSMSFRLRKAVLYALTYVTLRHKRITIWPTGRKPTDASRRKTFLQLIQLQHGRSAAIITAFAKLMRK